MTREEQIKALDEIYSKLPKIDCKKKCQEACGPILCTPIEWSRITKRLDRDPKINCKTLTCPLLIKDQCKVYNIRPIICRLYGLVKEMQCEYGCIPEHWLTDKEAREILDKIKAIDGTKEIAGPAMSLLESK